MGSHLILVCRALVLLACLVVLPLAAVTGGSLPWALRTMLELPSPKSLRDGWLAGRGPAGGGDASRVHGTQRATVWDCSIPVDELTQIEERFRALGAVHYRLEAWGQDPVFYRFQCQMALATADLSGSQHFEATDRAPLAAMRKVLAAVEAWRVVGRATDPAG